MTLPVAILAGGLATRMGSLTERVPKALLEVAGRPFAVHQIELLRRHGYEDLVFCVGHLGEQIEEALGDGSQFGVRIRYSFEKERLGTGGALLNALPLLGDAFLVTYGDAYLDCDYAALEQRFLRSGRLGLMAVFHNAGRWDKSNVLFQEGEILQYDKVKRSEHMEHIDYGVGGLRRAAFLHYPLGASFDLVDLYQALLSDGQLSGEEVPLRFYEIGSPSGLNETESYLRTIGSLS